MTERIDRALYARELAAAMKLARKEREDVLRPLSERIKAEIDTVATSPVDIAVMLYWFAMNLELHHRMPVDILLGAIAIMHGGEFIDVSNPKKLLEAARMQEAFEAHAANKPEEKN